MKLINQYLSKYKDKMKRKEDEAYNSICNIRERHGKLYIVIGGVAVSNLPPSMTVAEVINQLQVIRSVKQDYDA